MFNTRNRLWSPHEDEQLLRLVWFDKARKVEASFDGRPLRRQGPRQAAGLRSLVLTRR
jgi:hypothetical protein